MRISKEVLNKCNTLEELVEMMVTDKNGVRLNYSDVGETKDFISRYKWFKEYIQKELKEFSLDQIIFLLDNYKKITDISLNIHGVDRLLTALEFEHRKQML